jgi:predicted nucleotidyltransferase
MDHCTAGMKQKLNIKIPRGKIIEFCRRNHITSLSLFGSALRDDFREDSDIDLLVEFDSNHIPGLIRLAGMEIELTEILGRKVDLRTPQDLSRYFRQEVVDNAEVQYAEV